VGERRCTGENEKCEEKEGKRVGEKDVRKIELEVADSQEESGNNK
jgi:hypothetical protein